MSQRYSEESPNGIQRITQRILWAFESSDLICESCVLTFEGSDLARKHRGRTIENPEVILGQSVLSSENSGLTSGNSGLTFGNSGLAFEKNELTHRDSELACENSGRTSENSDLAFEDSERVSVRFEYIFSECRHVFHKIVKELPRRK